MIPSGTTMFCRLSCILRKNVAKLVVKQMKRVHQENPQVRIKFVVVVVVGL